MEARPSQGLVACLAAQAHQRLAFTNTMAATQGHRYLAREARFGRDVRYDVDELPGATYMA
jgi:hypothetical protein